MTQLPDDAEFSRRAEDDEAEPDGSAADDVAREGDAAGEGESDALTSNAAAGGADRADAGVDSAGHDERDGEATGDAAAVGAEAIPATSAAHPRLADAQDEATGESADASAASGKKSKRKRKKPRVSSWQRLRHSPRGMVLVWCFWLLMSWFAALWIDSATVAVRLMVFSSLFGLTIMWPLFRLSEGKPPMDPKRIARAAGVAEQGVGDPGLEPDMAGDGATGDDDFATAHTRRHPARLTAWWVMLDWVWLIMVFQAVIWPLRLTAGWTIEQALWLDVAVAAWSLMAGAAVAWGCQFPRGEVRTVAMAVCAVLVFAEPLAMGLINVVAYGEGGLAWTMHISPIQVVWELTKTPVQYDPYPSAGIALTAGIAAVLVWLVVIVTAVRSDKAALEAARV